MATNDDDLKALIKGFGQISGQLEVMQANQVENFRMMNESFKTMREEMHRMEDANKASMLHLEERVEKRFDSLGKRVTTLEEAEKTNGKNLTKVGVVTAGIGGAITYGFIEFLKRLH